MVASSELDRYFVASQRDWLATARALGTTEEPVLTGPPLAETIEASTGRRIGALMIDAKFWPIKRERYTGKPLWNDEQRAALAGSGLLELL